MSRGNPVRKSDISTAHQTSQEMAEVPTADPMAGEPYIAPKAEPHQSTPPGSVANFPAFGIPRVNSSPARSGPTMHSSPTAAYLRNDGGRVRVTPRGVHVFAGSGRDDEDGNEPLFDELIPPFATMRAVVGMGNGAKSSPNIVPESWTGPESLTRPPVKNMKLPPATKRSYRSSLRDFSRTYVSIAAPDVDTPSDPRTSPSPPPPEIQHRSSPPTPDDPTLMAVQFDPMELPPERRNPNGINWIVQSPEHGYLLMRHLEKQQRSLNQRQSLNQAPLSAAGEGPAMESNDTPSGEFALSQEGNTPQHGQSAAAPNVSRNLATGPGGTPPDASPNRWHSAQDPSGTWSAQQSPVRSSVPQGWQMNPQPYGQQSTGMIPPTGARAYQTPEGWTQAHPAGYPVHQPSSPLSPVQWQPGNGQQPPQQPQQQQQQPHPTPSGAAAPPSREGSWIPGDRRPPSSAASRWPTQSTPVPHGAAPQQWTPSMSNPPSSAVWQEHGHQPHPTIDGRADGGMRWVEGVPPNPAAPWDVVQTRVPGPGSNMVPMGEGGEPVPPTGYSIADAGRTLNTRVRSVTDGEGSAQASPVTWTSTQSAHPPWVQERGNPTVLPPDGRIQTPGGTGAMGGAVHSAPTPSSVHPPPTPTSHHHPPPPASSYGASAVYPPYTSQVGPPPPPPGSMAGREMQAGSQPDSLGTYAQSSMGPPPPPSMGPGPPRPGGYTLHGMPSTPIEAGNPYPPVPPPVPGPAPYRTAVPRQNMGMDIPPGAEANPNFYTPFHNATSSQQATPMTIDHAPPNSFRGYSQYPHMNASPISYPMVPNQQGPPNPQARRPTGPSTMGMNPYPNVGNQGIPQTPQDMYGSMMGMPYGAPPPPPQ